MLGIETIKEVARWNVNVLDKIFGLIEKGKQGKRITGWDMLQFIPTLIKLSQIISQYEQLGKEWIDLDENEKQEIKLIIKSELDIKDDFAEELSERIFYILMEIGEFITFLIKSKK